MDVNLKVTMKLSKYICSYKDDNEIILLELELLDYSKCLLKTVCSVFSKYIFCVITLHSQLVKVFSVVNMHAVIIRFFFINQTFSSHEHLLKFFG